MKFGLVLKYTKYVSLYHFEIRLSLSREVTAALPIAWDIFNVDIHLDICQLISHKLDLNDNN